MLGGDLNAKAAEWGESTDARGKAEVEVAARAGLIALNRGTVTTFRRPRYKQTTIDTMLASEGVDRTIDDWKVLHNFSASDHEYIFFSVQNQSGPWYK